MRFFFKPFICNFQKKIRKDLDY